jgi:hydroxysqualene dehydroxylase
VPSVAIIGAGWAGLAAAIEATQRGGAVTLFEMAAQCGGRARGVDVDGLTLDNGQHILIGAYSETLRLLGLLGADAQQLLVRAPLELRDASGNGLRLRRGSPIVALALAVARQPAWTWPAKLALLSAATRWALAGFRCDAGLDVATLTRRLPGEVRRELIDPLCVAALNTPSHLASASVFLRVLRDALCAGRGSSDLLLPKVSLSELFPNPARQWLQSRGSKIEVSTRVQQLQASESGWRVDDREFDQVVLATPPSEAARLVQAHAAGWAQAARAIDFEPIMTIYARSPGTRLPFPMLSLACGPDRPAQFVFDRGQLGGPAGLLAFVISGASEWVGQGAAAAAEASFAQAARELGSCLRSPLQLVQVLTDKRATFRCVPGLLRPPLHIAPGLVAAGDYVDGPYPATLEGAVRSGINAAHALC